MCDHLFSNFSMGVMSVAFLSSVYFPVDLCQIYWCPTQGAQDHQPLAKPFRYTMSLVGKGKEGNALGRNRQDMVHMFLLRQLKKSQAFFIVRNSACSSDYSRTNHLRTMQDHHPISERGRYLRRG